MSCFCLQGVECAGIVCVLFLLVRCRICGSRVFVVSACTVVDACICGHAHERERVARVKRGRKGVQVVATLNS